MGCETRNATAVLETGSRAKLGKQKPCLGGCGAIVSGAKQRCAPCQYDRYLAMKRVRNQLRTRAKAAAK